MTARRPNRLWIMSLTALGVCSAACERCAPGLVGEGVAKLTIRNAGSIIELINEDNVCGFESATVKDGVVVQGQVGKMGTATWTVTNCDIDLSEPVVKMGCSDVETRIGGRLRVSATRTIGGTVSGDPNNPVVPGGPDAVDIVVDKVQFEDFWVNTSEDDNVMRMKSGFLSFRAQPRLARSAETGVCMIPTPNIKISDIVYDNAILNVKTRSRNFNVDVPHSELWAVNGVHGAAENALSGKITVWTNTVNIDPGDGLDPNYNPETFNDSFTCTDDLATPVSFECVGLGPQLAQGASRLTVRTFGMLVNALDKDTNCGFSSAATLAQATTLGTVGGTGNVEIKTTGCTLQFPANHVIGTSCTGVETTVSGRVTVSGVKIIEGRLTGDMFEPAVPMKDSPARIEITSAQFDNFTVASDGTALEVTSGGLSGVLIPRVAKDSTRGACSVETGIARFENLSWQKADVIVKSPSGRFATHLDASHLRAVNGQWHGDTNMLRGSISVQGTHYDLPAIPGDDGLDPEYDQAKFDAGWQCGDVAMPPSFECHFVDPLAQGASQLSIKVLGTLAGALEADEACGFASPTVLDGVQLFGDPGRPGGTATFEIVTPCELSYPQPFAIEEDCNGTKTWVQGTARVTGTKSIHGWLSGHPVDAAVPERRDAVDISLDANFDDFKVWMEPGQHSLQIFKGGLSGTLHPRLAVDTVRGACGLPTPVAQFEHVTYRDAEVRIVSEGKTFDITVNNSLLEAQNGSKDGRTNFLAGTIVVDGDTLPVPTDGGAPVLDPEYDSANFTRSFACTADMRIPVSDDDCDLRQTIGEGAARLVVQTLGTVTKLVNEDNDCGFESNLTDPDVVQGQPGEYGQMEWQVDLCEMRRAADRVDRSISEDCNDTGTYYEGAATASARRVVRGIRENIDILFLRFYSISPNARDSVDVHLQGVTFDEFKTYEMEQGALEPRRALTVHSGYMTAFVQPVLGENRRNRGTYDVPTPLAHLQNIELRNATVTVFNEGMTFKVDIDSLSLNAFNGSYRGERNWIDGSLVVDGLPITFNMEDLDPEYDQAVFDERYECTSNLVSTVPPI